MIKHDLNLLQKQIRAIVINKYLHEAELPLEVVCFSCGNASYALKKAGLKVHEVLTADHWWTPAEIQRKYKCFDATSGHLPMPLMKEIADGLKMCVVIFDNEIEIPTCSGETIVCLRMAFPKGKFKPVYNLDKSTEFHIEAPLNCLVQCITY